MRGWPLPYTLKAVVVCCVLLPTLPPAASTPAAPTPAINTTDSLPPHPAATLTNAGLPHYATQTHAPPPLPDPASDIPATLPYPATTSSPGHTPPIAPETRVRVGRLIEHTSSGNDGPLPSTRVSQALRSDARVTAAGVSPEGLVSLPGAPAGLTRTSEGNPDTESPPAAAVVEIPKGRLLSASTTRPVFPSLLENLIIRRSPNTVTSDSLVHRRRHGHVGTPAWLRRGLGESAHDIRSQIVSSKFEEQIAGVFRNVAYGTSESEEGHEGYDMKEGGSSGGSTRIERTTVLSEEPQSDYVADGSDDSSSVARGQRNATPPDQTPSLGTNMKETSSKEPDDDDATNSPDRGNKNEKPAIEELLEPDEYDMFEGHYSNTTTTSDNVDVPRRGDTQTGVTSQWVDPSDSTTNESEVTHRSTTNTFIRPTPKPSGTYRPVSKVSWFDMLLCTNRNLTWVLINFLLGLIMLGLSFLGPYRLLTMRSCTHLLPRTHYVTVHLLVFVAASLKAVYLFHLAFGSRGRLPLVLILILTNTGFPCFSSAFLILMVMMFLTADVQVYKPKFLTVQNIFIFIVIKMVLCFVADVIVGSAHSKSVLVLARVMLIIVAVTIILIFIRKYQVVLQVSQLLQREFQGELKLLVLPAKDVSQQRQMGIKYILRNRLGFWCRMMKVAAVCVGLLAVIHLFHTIFLISSHVPAWAWWIFHVSGCFVEFMLAVSICVAAALTQRYDENINFVYSFLVPPILVRKKKSVESKTSNGEAVYQRVSFSSGTESTQYTTCYPEAMPVGPGSYGRTTKAPKRRSATVRRSATFSHAPYQRPEAKVVRARMVPRPLVPRTGSVSHIPMYGHPSGSHLSIYGPGLVSHLPIYSPPSDTSVLVHEDGFVRVRAHGELNDGHLYPRGSLIQLQQSHFLGSQPQLQGSPAQHLNGLGRQESFYASLSRQRRRPHGVDVLQNNIDMPDSEYHSSPSTRSRHSHRSHSHHPTTQAEVDYHSLSRKTSFREPHMEQLNNMGDNNNYPRRRRSTRELRHHHLNNLDRPESEYRNPTRRQVSRDDNNDPNLQLEDRRNSMVSPLNLYEEQHLHSQNPTSRHKISNYSVPTTPLAVSPHHNNYAAAVPRSPRESQFPKPFVRIGSNISLQGEEVMYGDYIPRGNPVRRNHSSAGYFPSRNMAPPSPSLVDAHRFGSLRLSEMRKRQGRHHGGYGCIKPSHRHYDKYPRMTEDEDTVCELPSSRGPRRNAWSPDNTTGAAHMDRERDCPSRQSNSSKRSDGTDQDWALELIKSSDMLADFYSLKRRKKENAEKASKTSNENSPEKNPEDTENTSQTSKDISPDNNPEVGNNVSPTPKDISKEKTSSDEMNSDTAENIATRASKDDDNS
ncbi:hypothetical protein Pcinc_039036 [Petrolisthes cinctipes]|uniref:Proline-rich transmembrane protein 3/4 domain-containing protein n=1 Tax=Petrolisthes cinctipes TaxID=88211 RepID=A0AAE1BP99_PETCI|nr:hypothetical protein Pcinc_039036 [Petrolisthes cinctipes]